MKIAEVEKDLNESYPDVSWNVLVIPYVEEKSSIGKRTVHSSDTPYAWVKNIISSKIDFNKPIVLCLGGTGIDDDQSANGIAKQAQILLGLGGVEDERLNSVQLLSVVYPKDLKRLGVEREKFKRGEPREKLDYIEGIYNTVFRPIIFPNGCLFENYEDVKRKFRNITVFSHCHGTFVACELVNYLKKDLHWIAEHENFSDVFCDNIVREITNIMLSPREGAQNVFGALNLGFTFATDNLPGGVDENIREGSNLEVYDFSNKLKYKKIQGSETFYYKSGSLYNFWDTDRYGADIEFVENSDADWGGDFFSGLVYENLYARETPYFHLFENYCSMFARCEDERVGFIQKNTRGCNFTKIIAKALQNAVSLSIDGKKRYLKNVVSNETRLSFLQGDDNKNINFKDVRFDGNLKMFSDNYKSIQSSKLADSTSMVEKIVDEVKSKEFE